MGTRGVTGFVADEKWYVSYNHFDSYPEGLGMEVLEFCKSVRCWDTVKKNVKKVVLVDKDTPISDDIIRKYMRYSDTRVSERSLYDWYCLLRNLQGVEGLKRVASGEVSHMLDSHAFMADSLFCEWGYIIDLDDYTLKVYKGFNPTPSKKNFLPPDINPLASAEDGYYPVNMLYAYSLSDLPEFMLGVTNEFKKRYRKSRPLTSG